MQLAHWGLLGFATWTIVLLISTVGVTRIGKVVRKEAQANSFSPNAANGTDRYQRCMRAHLNCVENLPVYASLVLLAGATHVSGPLFQIVAFTVLPARLLQSAAHIASGRNRAVLGRFTFFSVQMACFLTMGALIALHGSSR